MTRFARAKGSKSSNERLPDEATPWHVMKQQLDSTLEKDQTPQTKTKTAKQLLNEKDLYYADTVGNVNFDWAEFDNPKKTNAVKNGKVAKKPKDQNKKVEKAFQNSKAEESTPKPEIVRTELKNEQIKAENTSEHVAEKSKIKKEKRKAENTSQNESEKTNVKNVQVTVENTSEHVAERRKIKKEKRKAENIPLNETEKTMDKNVQVTAENTSDHVAERRKIKKEKRKAENISKKEIERAKDSNGQVAAENTSEHVAQKRKNKKEKKKAKNTSQNETERPGDNDVLVKADTSSDNKSDERSDTKKLSKRQKRNIKKVNQKTEDKSEHTTTATFNTEGNDWDNSVSFNKRRKFDDNQDRRPMNNGGPNNNKDRPVNSSFNEDKVFMRFGNNIPRKFQKKTAKIRDDREHSRRKPDFGPSMKMTINGMDVEIVKYDGFPVKKEDAERLAALRKEMVLKAIPKSEIDAAMKLERRKCEKALARIKKQVCFHCRKAGHNLSDCPELGKEEAGTGICFKCGSTEHTHFECKVNKADDYKYAKCFICREQGHIAKQCPDNPKGLYPDGGSCKICGEVTHLKKDCPDLVKEKEEAAITLDTIRDRNLEVLDDETTQAKSEVKPSKKIVKF